MFYNFILDFKLICYLKIIRSIFIVLLLFFCLENVSAVKITKHDFVVGIEAYKANKLGEVKLIREEE